MRVMVEGTNAERRYVINRIKTCVYGCSRQNKVKERMTASTLISRSRRGASTK